MDIRNENVRNMLVELGGIYKNMPESSLKKEYSRFMLSVSSGIPFNLLLSVLHKKIAYAKQSQNTTTEFVSRDVVEFWQKILDLIIHTFNKNKDLI